MNRKAESLLEVFIAAALLVVCDWFIAGTWATNNLGAIGSLIAALLFAILAIGLVCRAILGFVKQEKGIE
jgi:hypothetical protein